MADLLTLDALAALVTLTVLEIVLGVDNIVIIALVTQKLERARQKLARRVGLLVAMALRIVLVLGVTWLMGLTRTLFAVFGRGFSTRDLIMLGGGGFLIAKATKEIHDMLEGPDLGAGEPKFASFGMAIAQIAALDIIFSLDSVLTAVGMTKHVPIMVAAIALAVLAMLIFAEILAAFIERHPTTKALALAFVLLIGVLLVADGLGEHIPRGYVYFALAFSVLVEGINIRVRRREAQSAGKPRA